MNLEMLTDLTSSTDKLLWQRFASANSGQIGTGLIFPHKRDRSVRVSEQEARQSFAENIPTDAHAYSVETPTENDYSFSGEGARSAATDLTIYSSGKKSWNVEFKAKGFTENRQDLGAIEKDIEKLVKEDVNGLWFHTLEVADSRNLTNLWNVIRSSLKRTVAKHTADFRTKEFVFHCCVLKQKVSIHTSIPINADLINDDWLGNHGLPNYELADDCVIFQPSNKWTINPPQQ